MARRIKFALIITKEKSLTDFLKEHLATESYLIKIRLCNDSLFAIQFVKICHVLFEKN